jgi:choline dehydrogenase-like flavoprotein
MILPNCDGPLPKADVCVVGAGPTGLALAFKLEDLGLSVLLLEAGAAPDSGSKDSGSKGSEAGGNDSEGWAPTEFTTLHHAVPNAATHAGIGGTTALWGGRCVAFDDLDFDVRPHVPYSGWPIGHEDVSRHYEEALVFLRCGTAAPPPHPGSRDEVVHLDAIERWSRDPVLGPLYEKRLSASTRITLLTGVVATDIRLSPDGKCVEALEIRHGGRSSTVAAGLFVLAAGGLETARLLLGVRRRSPAAFGGPDGPLGRFYQGHLTGYLAVIELASPELAAGLSFQADEDGFVMRRRLQLSAQCQALERTLNTVFWTDAISVADPLHGSGTLSLLYLMLSMTGLYRKLSRGLAPRARPARQGELRAHLANIRSSGISLRHLLSSLKRLGRGKAGRMLQNPSGRYLLRYHAEQAPNPDSRVHLRETPGGAMLSVHYQVSDDDVSSVLRSHAVLDAWLRRNGLGKLIYVHDEPERKKAVLGQAFDGYHQIGLARMADDAAAGVVDRDCRVHDVANLYLAGASVFPTGGQANPTLPAVALALRLGRHLAEMVKRSRPARPLP